MICAACGTENAPGAKFCMECATRLSVVCPACGSQNAPTAKFCSECATSLAAPRPAAGSGVAAVEPPPSHAVPVAERRLVSVLFADLVGFTTLAEGRDPEETRELLTRYFDLAREVVERYGGVVEKFIGDAVMAVWGAPVAREDDAERAVRAGLDLVASVRSLGPDLQARAGVLTGEALPLRCCSPAGSKAIARSAARCVASPTRTDPGAAADWSLEAVFTRSPATIPWPTAPRVTAASPVRMPARAWSPGPRERTASTRSSAARTARSASSSRATGAPQTAMIASPMNFSTRPP